MFVIMAVFVVIVVVWLFCLISKWHLSAAGADAIQIPSPSPSYPFPGFFKLLLNVSKLPQTPSGSSTFQWTSSPTSASFFNPCFGAVRSCSGNSSRLLQIPLAARFFFLDLKWNPDSEPVQSYLLPSSWSWFRCWWRWIWNSATHFHLVALFSTLLPSPPLSTLKWQKYFAILF